MSKRSPRRTAQTCRTLAAGVLVAGALVACDGDDTPAAENVDPSVAMTVEGVGDTTGTTDAAAISATTTPATTTPASVPSAVRDQVVVQYAGLTWSVEDSRFVTEDDGGDPQDRLHVDLLVENTNPFGMRWPVQVVALRRADGTALELDGQVDSNASRLEVPAHDRIRTTLAFDVEEVLEVSELSLTVAETDRIPAVASFASGAVGTDPYPVDVAFEGATKPLPLGYMSNEQTGAVFNDDDHARLVALSAAVTVDAPGVRAGTGRRLVVVDLRMDVEPTSSIGMQLVTDNYRLRVGDVASEPVALIEHVDERRSQLPTVEPGASEEFTVVFDVPVDASGDAALVVLTDEGFDQDEIPFSLPTLPPCCGE